MPNPLPTATLGGLTTPAEIKVMLEAGRFDDWFFQLDTDQQCGVILDALKRLEQRDPDRLRELIAKYGLEAQS